MFCLIVPLLNFNPRSHEGSDILPVPPPAAVSISIHAPTRGATQTDRIRDRQSYNFNPRSHEGSDGAYYAAQCRFHNFNPRSHEGSDGKDYFMGVYEHISIHAPTRGATFLL